MSKPNIEIKNLKVAEFMSDETLCYECSIWVDGKKAGRASNQGHGGCSDIWFADKDAQKRVEAYAASLPEYDLHKDYPDLGPLMHQPDLESVIEELMYAADELRQEKKEDARIKRALKTKTLARLHCRDYAAGVYTEWKIPMSDKGMRPYLDRKYGAGNYTLVTCYDDIRNPRKATMAEPAGS